MPVLGVFLPSLAPAALHGVAGVFFVSVRTAHPRSHLPASWPPSGPDALRGLRAGSRPAGRFPGWRAYFSPIARKR